MNELQRTDLFNYLRAVKGLYPGGVPKSLISRAKDSKFERVKTTPWMKLKESAVGCTLCKRQHDRKSVVFGNGGLAPKVIFVRFQPEPEDDQSGDGLSGPEGELLKAAVTKGMKLKMEDVYVTGLLKCYSKNEEDPKKEISTCISYFDKEIELLRPVTIVGLGSDVRRFLLGDSEKFHDIRGRWKGYYGVPLIITHDIKEVLVEAKKKKEFWEDLKVVMSRLS